MDTVHKCGKCGAEFPDEAGYISHSQQSDQRICPGTSVDPTDKYLFIRRVPGQDDVKEYIPLERWTWKADYIDGNSLEQFDERDKSFHQIVEIDQSRLIEFSMVDRESPGRKMVIKFAPGTMRLIHFVLNSILNNGDLRLRIYVFGFVKILPNDTAEKFVTYILPNDEVVISDRDDLVFET